MNFPKKQEFQLPSVAAYNLIPEDYELYIGVPGHIQENARIEFYRKPIYLSSSDLARVVKSTILENSEIDKSLFDWY